MPIFKSVLCLNGTLPSRKTITKCSHNIPIIAADGAANYLINNDIRPQYIIGDLDSLDTSLDLKDIHVIKTPDQNYTDFDKCISYIAKNKLFPTLVLGMNGGEIDHILDNMNRFIKYSIDIPMVFFDEPNKWGIAMSEYLAIKVKKESTISIFPFEQNTHLKSTGLHWELDSDNHTMFKNTSTRNKSVSTDVVLEATKDKVLVIIENGSMPFKTPLK